MEIQEYLEKELDGFYSLSVSEKMDKLLKRLEEDEEFHEAFLLACTKFSRDYDLN